MPHLSLNRLIFCQDYISHSRAQMVVRKENTLVTLTHTSASCYAKQATKWASVPPTHWRNFYNFCQLVFTHKHTHTHTRTHTRARTHTHTHTPLKQKTRQRNKWRFFFTPSMHKHGCSFQDHRLYSVKWVMPDVIFNHATCKRVQQYSRHYCLVVHNVHL
jgi:hypothetical protein